ncbi:EscI/YscI/HrpB family type III secretion system inner rod protein [Hahella sp. KA22]|uniref:type III secretion system inner rod subunit SctI n=1 Tax=Hahella sp. KA22 TaxID=1628392 RepID=UPI000FDF02DC|nr:type III secretion system inner rod subunit SctI [Hahella sp. KA22]AZZ92388.1 EscI/YscI/HrpB family type III secretion system inner rod protein [Hahella sp. KA22]QAY55762.1 EscI/YscI/HrpB family type III secretion system inner rod protein [Hahella sp. KA22]
MDPINIQYSLNFLNSDQLAAPELTADPAALEHFQQSLQLQPDSMANSIADSSPLTLGVEASEGTLGDKVLQGMQNVKSGYDQQVEAMQLTLNSADPLNMSDMLKLQMDLAQLTLQGELISKTVSKSTQNLDTLLKSQ